MHRCLRHLAIIACLVAVLLTGVPASAQTLRASALQIFVEPQSHTAPVLSLIRSARHSIRLEVYLLTNRTIISALGRAHAQGVDVRVLLEERPYGSGRYARLGYGELQSVGVQVRWANESAFTYTHEKAMVVDGNVAGIFTMNLTSSGLLRNREFGIVDRRGTDAAALATIFDADWNRRRPALTDPALVVSPINSRRDLLKLIDNAHSTLDVYAEEVADGTVEGHLERAVARRVRVRLITSASSAGVQALQRSGVSVGIVSQPYIHAKAIVADNTHLFVGSENLSSTSLDRNREIGLLTTDRDLVRTVESTFNHDWQGNSASTPPIHGTQGHGGLPVHVHISPQTVRRGGRLVIAALTRPGALCRVRLTYPDGYTSRARALRDTLTAGSTGTVSWTTHIFSRATGPASARVNCMYSGQSGSGSERFVITG